VVAASRSRCTYCSSLRNPPASIAGPGSPGCSYIRLPSGPFSPLGKLSGCRGNILWCADSWRTCNLPAMTRSLQALELRCSHSPCNPPYTQCCKRYVDELTLTNPPHTPRYRVAAHHLNLVLFLTKAHSRRRTESPKFSADLSTGSNIRPRALRSAGREYAAVYFQDAIN